MIWWHAERERDQERGNNNNNNFLQPKMRGKWFFITFDLSLCAKSTTIGNRIFADEHSMTNWPENSEKKTKSFSTAQIRVAISFTHVDK